MTLQPPLSPEWVNIFPRDSQTASYFLSYGRSSLLSFILSSLFIDFSLCTVFSRHMFAILSLSVLFTCLFTKHLCYFFSVRNVFCLFPSIICCFFSVHAVYCLFSSLLCRFFSLHDVYCLFEVFFFCCPASVPPRLLNIRQLSPLTWANNIHSSCLWLFSRPHFLSLRAVFLIGWSHKMMNLPRSFFPFRPLFL